MTMFRLKVGVVETITTEKFFEVEADTLEIAKNLAVTLDSSCKLIGEQEVSSEITDIELTGDFEVLD
jgi:membrane protease subunit (stomatin/prohibitin family)